MNVLWNEKSATCEVSDGEEVAKDCSSLARASAPPVFRRPRSSQATGDLMSVSKGVKTAEKPSGPVVGVAGYASLPVLIERKGKHSRSSISKALSSGMADADLIALRRHMQKL